MAWVDVVGLLAIIQLFVFGFLVARARGTYGVAAPATTGHPMFERYYRVQVNTVECLIVFLPALWLAAKYWPPGDVAAVGAIYLVGRILYLKEYVSDPKLRSPGYGLSMLPALALAVAALVGAIRALLRG